MFRVSAKQQETNGQEEEGKKKSKQSLFSSVTEALDFSQVRSGKDAELLDEAREATRSGGRMSREQVTLSCFLSLLGFLLNNQTTILLCNSCSMGL